MPLWSTPSIRTRPCHTARRQCGGQQLPAPLGQLRHHFPHLVFKDVRGNVITRLEKLDAGQYDCLILAAAGLGRLGLTARIHERIDPSISLHAVGQGALGIECRHGDDRVISQLKALEHTPSSRRCLAERAFLRQLEGGCQVPIGVNTSFEGEQLVLTGMVASLDGQRLIRDQASRRSHRTRKRSGSTWPSALRSQGAGEILEGHLCHRRDAVTEEAGEEGCRGPCSGSAQGGSFPMESAGWAALVGVLSVLPWWAFTFCWASPTGSCSAAWSRGVMGLVGTLAAKPAPLEVFSPDPEASTPLQSVTADRPRWDRLSAASTGAFGGAGGPPGSQLAELVAGVGGADAGRGARWWPASTRQRPGVQDCPA